LVSYQPGIDLLLAEVKITVVGLEEKLPYVTSFLRGDRSNPVFNKSGSSAHEEIRLPFSKLFARIPSGAARERIRDFLVRLPKRLAPNVLLSFGCFKSGERHYAPRAAIFGIFLLCKILSLSREL